MRLEKGLTHLAENKGVEPFSRESKSRVLPIDEFPILLAPILVCITYTLYLSRRATHFSATPPIPCLVSTLEVAGQEHRQNLKPCAF